ncbi:MAG: dNTP triphosphohydrolase [Phycisphaerae bacterium]|nr:dNTP triphosphohydrolase [Phycisphaerae bacterium]
MTAGLPEENALASYATTDDGGRVHDEPADPLRTPFELDAHRIVGCTAFRRLEHKTQVFAPEVHDHFRTRLTHTLEASRLARCLARSLRANELLAEAIVLAHDLGHPPFGHAGEKALNEALSDAGGFNHNAHTLRVVTYLEHPFPAFRGLNLTRATLAGLARHETGYDQPVETAGALSVEAQIGSLADRLAYNIHDLEDAIGAGLVDERSLSDMVLWREARAVEPSAHRDRPLRAVRRAVLDAMLTRMIQSVIEASSDALAARGAKETTPMSPVDPVRLTAEGEELLQQAEQFLRERVYSDPTVAAADARGKELILALFEAYRRDPLALPERFRARIDAQGTDGVIRDYIAGMTDRFCRVECERMLGLRLS